MSWRVIGVGGRTMRAFSAPLPETRLQDSSNHKKMTKFRTAALEYGQSYFGGQGVGYLLAWSEEERRTDARCIAARTTTALITAFRDMAMLPHCLLCGRPLTSSQVWAWTGDGRPRA